MFGLFKANRKTNNLIKLQNDKLDEVISLLKERSIDTQKEVFAQSNGNTKKTDIKKVDARYKKYNSLVKENRYLLDHKTNLTPIKFNPNQKFESVRFTSGSKSAAFERLIWAIQKRGGKSTVQFSGVDMLGSAKNRSSVGMVYSVASKLGLQARAVVSKEAAEQGGDVILISIE